MNMGDPFDPEALAEAPIWASPGVVVDDARPELGTVAALTVVPSITAHTHDDYPGAEPIDLVLSSLLAQGFALLTGFGPMELVELPVLVGWSARLDSTGQLLELGKPDEVLYNGNLGPAVPMGWHAALRSRGLLAVLVASTGDPRGEAVAAARKKGSVVGAQVRFNPR